MSKNGRDLGTFHVKVMFKDGAGFVMKWNTGGRFMGGGSYNYYPLTANWSSPIYESVENLEESIWFMFMDGNYSCDCNLKSFLVDSLQQEDEDFPCGDELEITSLTLIHPNGKETGIPL